MSFHCLQYNQYLPPGFYSQAEGQKPCLLTKTLEHKPVITFWRCCFVCDTQNSLCKDLNFLKQNHNVRFFVCWCWVKCFIGKIFISAALQWEIQSQGFSANHLSVNLQQRALLEIVKRCFPIVGIPPEYLQNNNILDTLSYELTWP